MKCCPTCKRPFAPEIDVGGPIRQRVFDYIANHPAGVDMRQVMNHVYADDCNGGPESTNIIAAHVCHINRKLGKLGAGFRIKGRGGPGSTYRLVAT